MRFRIRTRRGLVAAVIAAQMLVLAVGLGLTVRLMSTDVQAMLADPKGVTFAELRSGIIAVAGTTGLLILALSAAASVSLLRRYDASLVRVNKQLEEEVTRRVRQALSTRHAMIFGLAKLADCRDTDTGSHLERISRYCAALARELRPEFPEIDDAWIERLSLASALHDIGKVGIPDAVLLKPGPLTPDERRLMERHTIIGADTLIAIQRRLGHDDLVSMGLRITLEHHERYDGSGYPFGLAGEGITLAARIVALADVYDALTSKRVYKGAIAHDEVARQLRAASGTQFDPRVVAAFDRAEAQIRKIRESSLREAPARADGVSTDAGRSLMLRLEARQTQAAGGLAPAPRRVAA